MNERGLTFVCVLIRLVSIKFWSIQLSPGKAVFQRPGFSSN
jgi:hypothetical protein